MSASSSMLSPKSQNTWGTMSSTSWMSFASFEADGGAGNTPPGMLDLNQPGVIPLFGFCCAWVFATCAVMLAIILIYTGEVLRLYNYAEDAGLAHAQLEASKQLHSASLAVEVVQAALAGGFLKNLSDFDTLQHIMRPVFQLSKGILREVELAGPPDTPGGSILVVPTPDGKNVSLMSDRNDCERIGKFGCSALPLSAANGQWYKDVYGIDKIWSYVPSDTSWIGPVFIRSDPFVSICEDLCWMPAFTFVGRAKRAGSTKASIEGLSSALPPDREVDSNGNPLLDVVAVRAVLSASVLKNVALTAAKVTKGEGMVATANGDVVAAEDMSSAVIMDDDSGLLKTRKVWTVDSPWFKQAEQNMVENGERGVTKSLADAIITARIIEGPGGDALQIGKTLRLVLGTPFAQYSEPTLASIETVSMAVACTPGGVMVACMLVALFFRYRGKSAQKDEKKQGWRAGAPGSSGSGLSSSLSGAFGKVKKMASNRQLALRPMSSAFRFMKRTKSFTIQSSKPQAVPGSNELMQIALDEQFGGRRHSASAALAVPD